MSWRAIAAASLLVLTGLSCGVSIPPKSAVPRPGVAESDAPADDKVVSGQVVYVPAYSHVETGDNRQPLNLATTLFVRNIDPKRPIVLIRVHYFGSGGKLLRDHLARPIKLDPLASVDFFVPESDLSGGASPSFLVEWVATEVANDPVIESVMIGTSGTQGISFTGLGRVIQSRTR